MPAPTRYRLFDLLTLTERLLAPVIDAVRAERPPAPAVVRIPVTAPASPDPAPARSTGMPTPLAPTAAREGGDESLSGQAIGTETAGGTGPVKEERAPADPLFVRRDRGKLIRYVEAEAGDPGERFRRRVKNGKVRYERAT